MTRTLVDTGPLVAYLNRRDRWHRWVVGQMAALSPPLLTCEAVITEACSLIRRAGGHPASLVRKVLEGTIAIDLGLQSEAGAIEALLRTVRQHANVARRRMPRPAE